MSDRPAAIQGDFASYRPVMGRKVLQLVVEVAIERQAEVFAALGYPTGGGSIPVAIARLEERPAEPRAEPREAERSNAVQQAGIVCKEPEFWAFLTATKRPAFNEQAAAQSVRWHCRVHSRKDITPGSEAEHRWNALLFDYAAWRRRG